MNSYCTYHAHEDTNLNNTCTAVNLCHWKLVNKNFNNFAALGILKLIYIFSGINNKLQMKINSEELLLSLGKVALHGYRALVSNDSIAIKVI